MGAKLTENSAQLDESVRDLSTLDNDLKFELLRAGVDAAGVIDPTPVSDLVGAGLSLAAGDLVGAGLSLISIIPYAGDAIGKTAKGARALKKMNDLRKRINASIAAVNRLRKAAKRKAASAIRAKRKAEAAKKAADARKGVQGCSPPANRFGTRLPTEGKWAGEKGHSVWTSPDGVKVRYKDGYPDFPGPPTHAKGSVEIDMKGNRTTDFTDADEAMRKQLGDPNWERPEGMTWHHKEDGVTMELVPSEVHDAAQHTGGVSMIQDPEY